MLAVDNVELPAVPRTGDDVAGKLTFAERAALMWANAVERVHDAVDVEQRHYAAAGDSLEASSRRAFGQRRHANPIGHLCCEALKFENRRGSRRLLHRAGAHVQFGGMRPAVYAALLGAAAGFLGRVSFQRRCSHQYCSGACRIVCSSCRVYHWVMAVTLSFSLGVLSGSRTE